MRHVTRLCIGAAAALTISVAAQAADLSAPVSKKPALNWTGWYAGVSAGYGWSNSHVDPTGSTVFCIDANIGGSRCTPAPPFVGPNSLSVAQAGAIPPSLLTHPAGAMLGGHAGYNYQAGSALYGVETDISWTNIDGSNTQSGAGPVFPLVGFGNSVNAQALAEQKLRYFGTLRGRAGYLPADSLLLFVTGGLAYGQLKSSTTLTEALSTGTCACGPITPALGSVSTTRAGWTVGFGAEFILPQQQHWSFKAEYLYFDLGNVSYQSALTLADTAGRPVTAVAVSSSATLTGSIFRAGFNYLFN
jgi:outer membrane immunogenic protein